MSDLILHWFPILFGFGVLAAFGWVITIGIVQQVRERRKRARRLAVPPGHFVFAKILDPIGPMERGEKYERPMDQALEAQGFGRVTGGGTQLRQGGGIEWVGL